MNEGCAVRIRARAEDREDRGLVPLNARIDWLRVSREKHDICQIGLDR